MKSCLEIGLIVTKLDNSEQQRLGGLRGGKPLHFNVFGLMLHGKERDANLKH
jgi:hypothetical protein